MLPLHVYYDPALTAVLGICSGTVGFCEPVPVLSLALGICRCSLITMSYKGLLMHLDLHCTAVLWGHLRKEGRVSERPSGSNHTHHS